ncbi:hypothetical protein DFP72DRAFT_813565 [Ephemerocybe angulata]|uniref:MYND-type domain-containing protein n=1 Tax=Ephemerocybe angulata TaxID=980116 RepID=A0A8H6M4B5_9AGAR|nr:hypothetical protein DFP72DRAFT_813565 [Tulosesus angulatus]
MTSLSTDTLAQAVDYLAASLENPLNSATCAVRMRVVADRLDDAYMACTSPIAQLKLAKSYPKLSRATVRFLTTKRSPSEHKELIEHLSKCRCPLYHPGMALLHNFELCLRDKIRGKSIRDTHMILQIIRILLKLITTNLTDLARHKFRSKDPAKPASQQPWPHSGEDLLPFGVADSVDGLTLWALEPDGGHYIYQLAAALGALNGAFLEAMIRPPDYTFAIREPLKHLEAEMAPYVKTSVPADLRVHLKTILLGDALQDITVFYGVLISHNHSGRVTKMLVDTSALSVPVFRRLSNLLAPLPRYSIWEAGREAIAVLLDLTKMKLARNGEYYLPKGQEMTAFNDMPPPNPFDDTFVHLWYVRKGGCCNPECPSPTTSGAYAKSCGACKMLRFCDQKCQKEAWKHKQYPHKTLCAKITSLKQQLGVDNWSHIMRDAQTDNGGTFRKMCEARSVDGKLVKEIGDTLQNIRSRTFIGPDCQSK